MPTHGNGDPALKSHARKKLRDAVRRAQLDAGDLACKHPQCKHPDQPIDYTPRRTGQPIHPLSYVLDEITPRIHGGSPTDPTNVRPAHHTCNATAGQLLTTAILAIPHTPPPTAHRWG